MVAIAEVKTVMPQAHARPESFGVATPDQLKFDYWPDEPRRKEPHP